jgi:hypothetical protein
MPAAPRPIGMRFTSFRVAASNTATLALFFCPFGGEPDFSACVRDAVRTSEQTEVDRRERCPRRQIDRRDGVGRAVVRDVSHLPVRRRDDFVRVRTARRLCDDLQGYSSSDTGTVPATQAADRCSPWRSRQEQAGRPSMQPLSAYGWSVYAAPASDASSYSSPAGEKS